MADEWVVIKVECDLPWGLQKFQMVQHQDDCYLQARRFVNVIFTTMAKMFHAQ